jgi:glycogen debranching enzyme
MPYLHDLVTAVAAPWVVLSPRSGQLTGAGAEGVYARDRRILSRLEVTVDGRQPLPVQVDEPSAAITRYHAVLEGAGDPGHDPTVTLRRTRQVHSDGLTERITLVNRSRLTVDCELVVALGTDLAGTAAVRSEAAADLPELEPIAVTDGLSWDDGAGTRVSALCDPAPDLNQSWRLKVEPGEETTITLNLTATFPSTEGFTIEPPTSRPSYDEITFSCDDRRVERWFRRSLDDLAGLQLSAAQPKSTGESETDAGEGETGAERAVGGERYLGAGPPWYLTLFGRDSLISSGMLIPVDPELAAGTLRALAGYQGTRVDAEAAEQPGKIPHELRSEVADHGGGLVLPAAYYGTHDATQLWITTLHKAWRWGMPTEEVRDLLPALQRALTWMRDYADPDGDGFLEYIDESGHGLANQGWKDSSDSVQWPDGTIATAPIALCEVQGYAYAAAIAGAELLDAFDLDGGDEWREWAENLRERFRSSFWVDGYPAIALDGSKRPVAGPASNMGHLLGTGILDETEEAAVAAQLASADLDSGFGLRTLSKAMTRFNPLGYHTGSVWPHDTAMAVEGLYASDHAATATSYVQGLVDAAESFEYRLPELYGGSGIQDEIRPTPYPLSCRPQAWAAASAIAVIIAALGISPDAPNGTLQIWPAEPFPWRRLELRGLRFGSSELSLDITDGELTIRTSSMPEGQ